MKGPSVLVRRLLGGLLLVVLLNTPQSHALAPRAAGAGAQAETTSAASSEEVLAWADDQGTALARREIAPDASLAAPINIETWSAGVLEASDLSDPTEPTTTWAAVITAGGAPVGVLVIDAGSASALSGTIQHDAELAGGLAALPRQAIVLREDPAPTLGAGAGSSSVPASAPHSSGPPGSTDSSSPSAGSSAAPTPMPTATAGTPVPSLPSGTTTPSVAASASIDPADPGANDAWYALTGEIVTALDGQSRAHLAGPVALASYAQVLHDRVHGGAGQSETRRSGFRLDPAIIYTGIGVLIIGALIVTTTFVHERRVMAPLRENRESTGRKDPDQER